MKYQQLKTDCSVFVKIDSNGDIQIILAYVDDLIFVSSSNERLMKEVSRFLSRFEGTEEALEWYLGVRIELTKYKLIISQSAYIDRILVEFGFERCRTYTTPMASNFYDEIIQHEQDSNIDCEKIPQHDRKPSIYCT